MRHVIPLAAALLISGSAGAQQPTWADAAVVQVELSSFDFTPKTIHFASGRPVILRLVNTSSGGHNFRAPEFFAASQVREADRAQLSKGAVELPGRAKKEIGVIPKAGRYRLKCTHTLHSAFGMNGEILVN